MLKVPEHFKNFASSSIVKLLPTLSKSKTTGVLKPFIFIVVLIQLCFVKAGLTEVESLILTSSFF